MIDPSTFPPLKRLRSDAGETLVETLAAIVIVCLSTMLLAAAVTSSASIQQAADDRSADLDGQQAFAEPVIAPTGAELEQATVIVDGSTYDVKMYTGDDYRSYTTMSRLSEEIRKTQAWMKEHAADGTGADYSNLAPGTVYSRYNTDPTVTPYQITDEEAAQLFGVYTPTMYADSGYMGLPYIVPGCVYVGGQPVELTFIMRQRYDSMFRCYGFIYNGTVYGTFTKKNGGPSDKLATGMYIGGWGPLMNNMVGGLHNGTIASPDAFVEGLSHCTKDTGGTYL